MVSMLVLTMLCMGLLAGLLQSRRLTDSSVCQNSAQAAVQSYIEQLKNMSAATLCNSQASGIPPATSYALPTEINDTTADALYTTPTTTPPPDLSTLTPGVTPTGVVDNLKDITADPTRRGAQTTWAAIWPHASTTNIATASATPYWNDLHLNIWVWVTDLTPGFAASEKCYGITFIYTWEFWDGYKFKYYIGSVRTTHSAVPTYN
jgi:type II secretory pathway pseudopilin PulG